LFSAKFEGRGKRWGIGNVLYDNTLATTKGTITTTPFDTGANASGAFLTKGSLVQTQITTPTGTAATGTLTLNGQPSDADTFTLVIGGVTYLRTFKTALTPTAGEVLIGSTTAATARNLFASLVGSVANGASGTLYAAGTVAIPQLPISTALVYVSVPSSTNVITLTAVNTGTGANAYTLAKSGTNLAVSGANFTGGAAGDTISSLVYQSSTTSGGSYATFATSALTGSSRTAERIEVAIGVTVNRWIKAVCTMSGSASAIGINMSYARFWQL
jgi:hypothetical protein